MVRVTLTELWARMVALNAALSPAQALERLMVAVAALVMGGWFLINGLPHPLWLLPFGMAVVGSMASFFELLILAFNDDNFDGEDDEDDEDNGEPGWELRA